MTDYDLALLAEHFKTLGDSTRVFLLLQLIRQQDLHCVSDLIAMLHKQGYRRLEQPTISYHLQKMRRAGLLSYEKEGLYSFYTPTPSTFKLLHDFISECLYTVPLARAIPLLLKEEKE